MTNRHRPGKKERQNSYNFQKPSDGVKPAYRNNGKPDNATTKRKPR